MANTSLILEYSCQDVEVQSGLSGWGMEGLG